MIQTKCTNCNNTYETFDASSRFCSRECYMEYKVSHPAQYSTKQSYTCEYCGKSGVIRKPSEIRNGVFCSRSCANKAHSLAIANNPALDTDTGVEKTCLYCSKIFYVKPNRADKAKFCGMICSAAYRINRRISKSGKDVSGDKNPNYKNSSNRVTSRKIGLSRFGDKCAICGYKETVHVHHIISIARGGKNSEENLITLCPNHHALADKGVITEKELFRLNRASIAQQ